ncbi:MAG: S8 family serine peptidase [archaeon]|nr:S8 family serine peptidase [archaeon]
MIVIGFVITPILGVVSNDGYCETGELLLKFKPGVNDYHKERLLMSLGLEIGDEIPNLGVLVVSAPRPALPSIKSMLLQNPLIDFVEENHELSPSIIPNDQYYGSQWHLEKILAPEAWDISRGAGITVAVLDSGVDPDHPDLASKLIQGYNFYNNNEDTGDVYGHGTKVAGVVAALTNNVIGVSSIGWECSILPVRVTDSGGYTTYSRLIKGLMYAADRGAKVAVISFRIYSGSVLSDAAKYFMDKGGLVVAAGGNDQRYHSDLDNPYIISVSATTSSDSRASFSSYGPYVDLAAPGSGIYTTTDGGSYSSVSGTSFSAPLTAGLIALIFSANPSLIPTQVEQILESTAKDLGDTGYDIYYGWGRIDASRALAEAAKSSPSPIEESPPSMPEPDTSPPVVNITHPSDGMVVSGDLTVNVDANDDTGVSKVELYKDGALYSTAFDEPYKFYWDTTDDPNGYCTLSAKAYDPSDNCGESSPVIVEVSNEIEEGDTTPPYVKIDYPSDGSRVGWSVKIKVSASDESGIDRVEFYIDGYLKNVDYSYPYEYRWYAIRYQRGIHTITVIAYDIYGNCSEDSINVYR